MLKTKKSVRVLMALMLTGGFFSCSSDENLVVDEANQVNSQVASKDGTIIDTGKVYTITSTTTPITLSTSGFGIITDVAPTDITVRQLWKFTESSIDGSYHIDNLGEDVHSRLSTRAGINALTLEDSNSNGGASSWVLTPTGLGDYYFTNLRESENRRMTAFSYGFSFVSYGARTTAATDATDSERFTFTEVDFPPTENRAPITATSHLSLRPFGSGTANVLSNDFDPDGDELTLVSFTNTDDRVLVEMVGNSLQIRFNSFSFDIVEVTYVVSDDKGATSTGVLRVARSGRGNNG